MTRKNFSIENMFVGSVVLLVFLIPLFFITSPSLSFQYAKSSLIYGLTMLALCFWVVTRLQEGKFTISKNPLFLSALAVPLVVLLSALFSGRFGLSALGQGFEVDTFSFVALMFILMGLVASSLNSSNKIFLAYLTIMLSVLIVGLFHFFRFVFGVGFLRLGYFTDLTSNTIGSWNDLGVYFGLNAILCLIALQLISLNRLIKILCYLSLGLSLFFLSVINFSAVWLAVGALSLVFFIYDFASIRSASAVKKSISILPLVILLISFVFILISFKGHSLYSLLSSEPLNLSFFKGLEVNSLDVRPSWNSTLSIAQSTMLKNPLLGAGPNRFVNQWLLLKPNGVNTTVFWNVDFNYGVGFIPTFLVTTGLLGALAWLFFLSSFIYFAFKASFVKVSNPISSYLIISSSLASLYLWIFDILYVPSAVIIALTFIFTGLCLSSMLTEGVVKVRQINYLSNRKLSFCAVLGLILVLLCVVTFGYTQAEKVIAAHYFQKGLALANGQDLNGAALMLERAASLASNDIYARSLVDIDLVKMNNLINQTGLSSDSLKSQFQIILANAEKNARLALSIDSKNYQNWLSLGKMYEFVLPYSNQQSYDSAKNAYLEALKLNPHNPSIYLVLARMEVTHKNTVEAKKYITEALKQKNNYINAIFFLAQIQSSEGDIRSAISSVEALTVISPNDPGIFFQLGLLKYNDKNYPDAVTALERAITLNQQYANAKYFLALSYSKLGRVQDSINLFKDLKRTNPDNAELDSILKNLAQNKPPLSSPNDKPEKGQTPPIKEEN